MYLSKSIGGNYTQTLSESCQGDSRESVQSYPAASGAQIRHMMRRCEITISQAANIFEITKHCVRMRRRYGVSAGVHSWEWMRWLPQRFLSIQALKSPSAWRRSSESQTIKLLMVTNWGERIPCVAIKWVPDTFEEKRIMHTSTTRNDTGQILFGRLDAKWSCSTGKFQLPVLSKCPEDQLRAYGSQTLLLAYQYVEEHWNLLESGETIDLTTLAASAGTHVCRQEILQRDRGLRVAGNLFP